MQNLFNCAKRFVWIADSKGRITAVKNSRPENTGYTKRELSGKSIIRFFPVEEQNKILGYLRLSAKKTRFFFESNLIAKDNSLILCKINLSRIKLSGKIYFMFCFTQNKLEKALYYKMINRIQTNTIDDLILGIMHEINNPNNFLMLNVPYLQSILHSLIPLGENHHKCHPDWKLNGLEWNYIKTDLDVLMNDIYMGINRIKKITSSLTGFFERENVSDNLNVLEVISSSLNEFEEIFQANKIKVDKNFGNLCFIGINGDKKSLKIAVSNIIQNSIESFCPSAIEKSISIAVRLYPASQSLHIIISDTGCGIDQDILFKVFNPFFTTKRDKNQAGLGLYISKYIIKQHGGQIHIESEHGEWTRINLKLPYLTVRKEK